MNLQFFYKNVINLSQLKIDTLTFTMYILTIILFKHVRRWKIDFLQLRLLLISLSMNIFFAIKDYGFSL